MTEIAGWVSPKYAIFGWYFFENSCKESKNRYTKYYFIFCTFNLFYSDYILYIFGYNR